MSKMEKMPIIFEKHKCYLIIPMSTYVDLQLFYPFFVKNSLCLVIYGSYSTKFIIWDFKTNKSVCIIYTKQK